MKKKYSLDFSIVRDVDRMHAVEEYDFTGK